MAYGGWNRSDKSCRIYARSRDLYSHKFPYLADIFPPYQQHHDYHGAFAIGQLARKMSTASDVGSYFLADVPSDQYVQRF